MGFDNHLGEFAAGRIASFRAYSQFRGSIPSGKMYPGIFACTRAGAPSRASRPIGSGTLSWRSLSGVLSVGGVQNPGSLVLRGIASIQTRGSRMGDETPSGRGLHRGYPVLEKDLDIRGIASFPVKIPTSGDIPVRSVSSMGFGLSGSSGQSGNCFRFLADLQSGRRPLSETVPAEGNLMSSGKSSFRESLPIGFSHRDHFPVRGLLMDS